MKVRLLFGVRFDLLSLAGLLVGLAFSSPAPAQDAPDVVWEVAGTNSVSAVAFSPDGLQVASGGGSQNPSVEVWDAADGSALATFPAPSRSGAFPTGTALVEPFDNALPLLARPELRQLNQPPLLTEELVGTRLYVCRARRAAPRTLCANAAGCSKGAMPMDRHACCVVSRPASRMPDGLPQRVARRADDACGVAWLTC